VLLVAQTLLSVVAQTLLSVVAQTLLSVPGVWTFWVIRCGWGKFLSGQV
jgi:hypothetical protein